MRTQARLLVGFLLATAAGCGGGGGDSGQPANSGASGNRPPTISGVPSTEVMVGYPFEFRPASADADGDPLSFGIENKPSWATFDEDDGTLRGTPGDADVGTYSNVRINVSDGKATVSLDPFSITVVATGPGAATLTWTPPDRRANGQPLSLSGFRLYWGQSSRNYARSLLLDPTLVAYVVTDLTPGTWYFAITALDENGLESDYSNEVSKQVE